MFRLITAAITFLSLSQAHAQNHVSSSIRRQDGGDNSVVMRSTAPFYHGVASGDPLSDRVIIWTRYTPADTLFLPADIQWQMATDLAFTAVVANGIFTTDTSRDYTVKVDVTGLLPDTYYYYRFLHNGSYSLIGRTKTTPVSTVTNLKFGVVSCSDYRQGYFTAYRKMAERNDLDAVLHLGDYIYETGGGPAGREHDPNAEIWRIHDYRTRMSQYHLDPDLMRCHQVYPFITIWDDHDIVVDALRDTSLRHDAAFGNYSDRKYAAIKAAREWLPMRDDTSFYKNWRKFSYGGLADVFMIDARLYDRDRFAVDASDTLYGSPFAKIIGPEQMQWLNTGLANSTAQWKVIGNQLMMGHFRAITNDPLVFENWDGYPAEREQFLDNIIDNNIDNVVVVTGDFHCSFALDLCKEPRDIFEYNPFNGNGSKCVEFIVPSVTGDNFDEGNNFGLPSASIASTLISTGNQHIKYAELENHGYVLLDLNPTRAQAEFWHMADIDDPLNNTENANALWYAANNGNKVVQGSVPSSPKPNVPAAPPAKGSSGTSVSETGPVVISVAPNPVYSTLSVVHALDNQASVVLEVYDMQGRCVIRNQETKAPGYYTEYLNCQSLVSGTYILILSVNGVKKSYRFIKA
jgi:alkaline phosphatase D